MKRAPIFRTVARLASGLGVLALCLYLCATLAHYALGSPWHLRFQSIGDAIVVTISCPHPHLPAAEIVLKNTHQSIPLDATVDIDGSRALPVGTLLFKDTTLRPGRIIMSIHGHEIDVMQRALIVDKKEYSWRDNLRIEL